jgi:hypothetical protein
VLFLCGVVSALPTSKKKPHKVFLYEKADMDGLKTFIKDKLSEKTRGSHISSADVSEHWNYLKRTITEAIRNTLCGFFFADLALRFTSVMITL